MTISTFAAATGSLNLSALDANFTAVESAQRLAVTAAKTLTATNTLTLAGTDGSTLNVGAGGTLGSAALLDVGTTASKVVQLNSSAKLPAVDGSQLTSVPSTMVYPGAGVPVSTSAAWGTSKTTPSGTLVGTTDTQALTNKQVTLSAGTAASGSAPLKFTSGTPMATPEAGAIEFNTDAFYATITTGAARKQIAYTDSNITGNADTATLATNATNATTSTYAIQEKTTTTAANASFYPLLGGNSSTGYQDAYVASGITFNPSTNTLSATSFNGTATKASVADALSAQYIDWDATSGATSIKNRPSISYGISYKGSIDCSLNPNYPAAAKGDAYIVSIAGKVGGGSGTAENVGDMIVCNTDGTVSGTEAAVGTYWNHIAAAVSLSSIIITGGSIDGVTLATSNITVGAGKTIDVSSGTLVLANGQLLATKLQNAATDLGAANVTVNLTNSNGSYVTNLTIDGNQTAGTHNELTLAKQAVGFTVAGGTTSKTLTVTGDTAIAGVSTAAQVLAGASATTFVAPSVLHAELVKNLKPTKTPSDNTLTVRTKSGDDVVDASNIISVAIPDATGYTFRSRAASYLSGTSVITLADGQAYWGKASLASSIYSAYLYAIWDGTGIVFALCGYSGITLVPTTTTVTNTNYFLLEGSSTYTRNEAHRCISIAKVSLAYNTAGAPDYIFSGDAQIIYGRDRADVYSKVTENTALAANLGAQANWTQADTTNARLSFIPPRSGKYRVNFKLDTEYAGPANEKMQLVHGFALTDNIGVTAYDTHIWYLRNNVATGGGEYHLDDRTYTLEHDFECTAGTAKDIDLAYKATLTKGTIQAGVSGNTTRMTVTEIKEEM